MTVAASPAPAGRVALGRLLWVGPLAIVASILANLLLRQIAVAALRPDPVFQPLTFGPPIALTALGVLGAVIVFGLVARFARDPIPLFRRIALVVLIVSFVPDILMLVTNTPGATVANVLVLMLMHVVAWAISVELLTRLTRA
jgi:hypothetical protein